MTQLLKIQVFMINKYLKLNYTMNDTVGQSNNNTKIEFSYIRTILFNSVKKALKNYEPLLIFGCSDNVRKLINDYKFVVDKYTLEEAPENSNMFKSSMKFIQDYNVDMNEIDSMVLKIVSNSFVERVA